MTKTKKANEKKVNMNEIVTDIMVHELENGVIPWEKEWVSKKGAYNRISGNPYSYLNQMILTEPGEYATYSQWLQAGGVVRKGEKAKKILTWKRYNKTDGTSFSVPKYINVFHISQVEGVEPLPMLLGFDNGKTVEDLINAYTKREDIPVLNGEGDKVLYNKKQDFLKIPASEAARKDSNYIDSLLTEIIKSTSVDSRVERDVDAKLESLVDEVGTSIIKGYFGLKRGTLNTVELIRVLKENPDLIVKACSKAEKVVSYIFGDLKVEAA